MPKPRTWRRFIGGPTALLTVLLLIATLAGFFGQRWWALGLFEHFRMQYLLLLGVAVIALLLCRRWWWSLLAAAGLATNAFILLPWLMPADLPVPGPNDVLVRVVHANVLSSNDNYDAVAAYVRGAKADVVFLQEVTPVWVGAMAQALPEYQVIAAAPRLDNFGIAALAKRAIADASTVIARVTHLPGVDDLPVIEAHIRTSTASVTMLSVHTLPPVGAGYAMVRDLMLERIGDWAATQPGPCIVIGDLNATPWSQPLRRHIAWSGLSDARVGRGIGGTWPATPLSFLPGSTIPIDHCLHSPGITVDVFEVGPDIGSDHRPLAVSLAVSPMIRQRSALGSAVDSSPAGATSPHVPAPHSSAAVRDP